MQGRRRSVRNLSRRLFETELLYSQDSKLPSRRKKGKENKASALFGSLGCSKYKENTIAGLRLLYLFATSSNKVSDFRRNSFILPVSAGVCLFVLVFGGFVLSYSSLAPRMGWL